MILFYVAALFVFGGGLVIFQGRYDNKPLKLLIFFIIAYVFRHVDDSQLVWAIELFFIICITKFKYVVNRGVRWYWLFIIFVIFSLIYSDNPLRGIPGIIMYLFPLFYYSLSSLAIRNKLDVDNFFSSISNYIWLLLLLSILSFSDEYVFVYYGMGICTIPVFLYYKTKKKKYIIHFVICLLPAIVLTKRTPLLGITVSMMVFSMLMYKWKAIIPSMLSVIIGIAIIFNIPSFREKIFYGGESTSLKDFSSGSDAAEKINMNGRLVCWSIAWEKFHEKSPYLGVGQGTVKAYIQSDKNEYKETFMLMHNDWLLILCEQGLIGLVLLLLFMLGILKRCVKYSACRYPNDLRLISAVCAGSVVSTMIHMFFENCMNTLIFATSFVFYAIFNFYVRSYSQCSK